MELREPAIEAIQVAMATDEKYAPYAATVIASAFSNCSTHERLCFSILTFGLSESSICCLQRMFDGSRHSLSVYTVAIGELASFPIGTHTANAYIRLLIPVTLAHLGKVIYLDADLLVLSSLAGIWQTDVTGVAGAAAPDAQRYFGGASAAYFASLGLIPKDCYFNSGVMLMNLQFWRDNDVFYRVSNWMKKNAGKAMHSDQSALNAVLVGQMIILPLRWNLQIPIMDAIQYGWEMEKQISEKICNPAIVHFTTSRKPWLLKYHLPYGKRFRRYLATTPFDRVSTKGFTPSILGERILEELKHFKRLLRHWIYTLLATKKHRNAG